MINAKEAYKLTKKTELPDPCKKEMTEIDAAIRKAADQGFTEVEWEYSDRRIEGIVNGKLRKNGYRVLTNLKGSKIYIHWNQTKNQKQ